MSIEMRIKLYKKKKRQNRFILDGVRFKLPDDKGGRYYVGSFLVTLSHGNPAHRIVPRVVLTNITCISSEYMFFISHSFYHARFPPSLLMSLDMSFGTWKDFTGYASSPA